MTLDWTNVTNLGSPIQTTGDDVIFSGHGAYQFDGETTVPAGVEFWLLSPPGASIADSTGQALEDMTKINKLGIKNVGSDILINNTPIVYRAGSSAPDYILQAPRGIVIKPGGPHILGVESDTKLSDLWARVQPFIKPGQTIRCYWAACTALTGATNPVVLYK
ncbi:MAG: putative adhesin [Methylobacter sp.]